MAVAGAVSAGRRRVQRGHIQDNCPTVMAIQGLVGIARANGTLGIGFVPPRHI
ncbi:hypothetical protein PENFLA_c011G02595 [Penicillium flavigenum]|uniref:Uncharacterized protein n=1 Tax=Penicillium flavigenum TaxID=254877 RepID=A0A1V6TAW6_9EURO|nr:hypothetical protein PENFLA_c011G02595 [Penicillium flavigenum]